MTWGAVPRHLFGGCSEEELIWNSVRAGNPVVSSAINNATCSIFELSFEKRLYSVPSGFLLIALKALGRIVGEFLCFVWVCSHRNGWWNLAITWDYVGFILEAKAGVPGSTFFELAKFSTVLQVSKLFWLRLIYERKSEVANGLLIHMGHRFPCYSIGWCWFICSADLVGLAVHRFVWSVYVDRKTRVIVNWMPQNVFSIFVSRPRILIDFLVCSYVFWF